MSTTDIATLQRAIDLAKDLPDTVVCWFDSPTRCHRVQCLYEVGGVPHADLDHHSYVDLGRDDRTLGQFALVTRLGAST